VSSAIVGRAWVGEAASGRGQPTRRQAEARSVVVRMVRPFLIASGLLAVGFCLASAPGASGADQQETGPGDSDRELPSPVSREARAAAKLVGRSVWGVVPDAPARKSEVTPGMVRGAAVAVGPGTLLASCRAVAGRERVGLVRLNKYRVARVAGSDPVADVCVLEVTDVPLNVAPGSGASRDLRPGSRPTRSPGQVGARAKSRLGASPAVATAGWPAVRAELALPSGSAQAVLFDGDGVLLGLGVPTDEGRVVAGPVTPLLAPGLANRDRGAAAAAPSRPEAAPARPRLCRAELASTRHGRAGHGPLPGAAARPAVRRPGLRATLTTPRGAGAVFRAEEPSPCSSRPAPAPSPTATTRTGPVG
jgi:translation initiation factor IF-2